MQISKTIIIAEVGVNHNGDISIAKELIDCCANAGADYVKFQTFSAEKLVTSSAAKAQYQSLATDPNESQLQMLKKLELSKEDHLILFQYCTQRNISFLSTGFDEISLDFLVKLGIDRVKIPSGEITNLPYLRHIGSLGLPVILSTGMSYLSEVEDAINVLELSGQTRDQITILHCNSEYPTPMSDVNLLGMRSMQDYFDLPIGYSDHTLGVEVPIAAVALGAAVIEKHVTLDRLMPGPDHSASIEPKELNSMIIAIRNIEKAMGDGIKKPSSSDKKNRPMGRKSIVAFKEILKGDIFTSDNLTTKRPGHGLSPMNWDSILGTKASRNYLPDELLEDTLIN
jgi:N,N'-diacetyllegionaminate synthase